MSHVFISYSRKDKDYANRLVDNLIERGFYVWIDDRIDYGDRWPQAIVQAIRDCAAFIVIMSPDAERSEWVEREVLLAQRERKPIFPLLLRGDVFPLLITTQCADVQDGDFPLGDFYVRLARFAPPASQAGGAIVGPSAKEVGRILPSPARAAPLANFQGLQRILIIGVLAIIGIFAIISSISQTRLDGDSIPTEAILLTETLTETISSSETPTEAATTAVALLATTPPPPTETLTSVVSETPASLATPTAPTSHEAALQHARDFQGGNGDWEPYVETFTFDNGVSIELALVPAGCFRMGNDPESYEGPGDGGEQCFEEPFWIGRYEVTNAEYDVCVEAGVCSESRDFGAGFNGPEQPVVGIDWLQTRQYVEWLSEISGLSFGLPTEAGWEYAARGPDGLIFPWGSATPSCDLSNYFGCVGHPAQVGSYSPAGNSWVGAADMAGNVWEWTNSIYQAYPYDPEDGRDNPSDASSGRVARGGSWFDYHRLARAAFRYHGVPEGRDYNRGFRVVYRPPSP